MQRTIFCKGCRKEKLANPKLKKGAQFYCGDSICQKSRKTASQKAKMATDPEYKANQKECQENWRKHKPKYMGEYRQWKPAYAQRNRELQRIRNQRRRVKTSDLIVKMDALTSKNSMLCVITPLEKDGCEKIVKMDALTNTNSDNYIITASSKKIVKMDTSLVQVAVIQVVNDSPSGFRVDCKDGPY